MYLYWTRMTHTQEHTAQKEVNVCTPKGRKWWGDRFQCHITHICTHWIGMMKNNDSLAGLSSLIDVLLVSAFPIINKKASQPPSLKTFNCLLLARLLSTRGHPPSSCKKGTRISKTSGLQRVRKYTWVHVCVWPVDCNAMAHSTWKWGRDA